MAFLEHTLSQLPLQLPPHADFDKPPAFAPVVSCDWSTFICLLIHLANFAYLALQHCLNITFSEVC